MENLNLDLFSPKKAELQELATKYAGLEIEGIDDKKGFEAVHKAEMELVKARTSITKICKEYTDQFERRKKEAWEVRDDLLGIIEPIEKDLKEKKAIIEAEKERIRQEELEKKRLFLQNRVDKLTAFGYIFPDLLKLAQMSEEEFDSLLVIAKENHEKFLVEKLQEEERRIQENVLAQKNDVRSKILNAQSLKEIDDLQYYIVNTCGFSLEDFPDIATKEKMIEQQEALKEQQKKIDQENARIQREKDEAARKKELEKAQEKARKEGEEKAKREAEEKRVLEEKKAQEELERKAQEEKAAQERLEKETRYKEFLAKNEGKYDKIVKEEGKVVLYKVIDEFIL